MLSGNQTEQKNIVSFWTYWTPALVFPGKKPRMDRQTDSQTNKQTNKHTNIQKDTDSETDTQVDRQTDACKKSSLGDVNLNQILVKVCFRLLLSVFIFGTPKNVQLFQVRSNARLHVAVGLLP